MPRMAERWPISIPRETVNDDYVVFVRWLVEDGALVETGTPVCEIETSKADVVIEAEHAGYIVQDARALDQVPVGAAIGSISSTKPEVTAEHSAAAAVRQSPSATRFSKKAEELVRTLGIDETMFEGRALVRERDVLAVANPGAPAGTGTRGGMAEVDQVIALDAAKRTEIRYLREASGVLMSAVTVLLRIDSLDSRIAASSDRQLQYLDFIVPAVASRLRDHPELNGYVDDYELHAYARVNVGVAMNLGRGLKVPVLRDADRLGPEETSRAIGAAAMRYLRGELTEDDLIQGTFTITDLSGGGMFQVLPRINRDQSAILAVGGDRALPGVLTLTLAFDHRATDGQRAGEFLSGLRAELEEHERAARAPACDRCMLDADGLRATGTRTYLVPVVRENGSSAYLCTLCLSGWNG